MIRLRSYSMFLVAIAIGSLWASKGEAQITLNEATMESIAEAETDAGPSFAYQIDNYDELDAFGPYMFSEFGTAPGYNSEAEVGTTHDSDLQSSGFELSGEAYAYCADDNGYAYLTADSQVGQYITFTLSEPTRLEVSGNLGLSGYPPVEADLYFAIRPVGHSNIVQQTVAGPIAFDQVVPAGTYQLSVLSRVWLEFDFAGGDLYEFSRGNFQVSVSATSQPVAPPNFRNVRHRVEAASFSDDEQDSLRIQSNEFVPFVAEADPSLSSVTSIASLNSDVDPASGVFYVYGYAASGLYVQGTAGSDTDAHFFTTFDIANSGTLELEGEVGVVDFLGTSQSQDRPGFARVIVRLRSLDTNTNVINKVITLNGSVPSNNVVDLEDQFSSTQLDSGRYRLIIRALARDDANYEEVAGSLAVGYLEVEGRITEQSQ